MLDSLFTAVRLKVLKIKRHFILECLNILLIEGSED